MGSSASQQVHNEVTTELLNSIMFKHSTACQSIMSSEQLLSVIGNGNDLSDISMEQTMTFKQDCRAINQMTSDIKAEMQDTIQQAIESKVDATAIASRSKNEVKSVVRKIVETNVTSENMLTIMSKCVQAQRIEIVGSRNRITKVSMKQLQTHFSNAASQTTSKIVSELQANTLIDTKSTTSVEGLGTMFKSLFSFLSSPFILFLVGAIIVVVVVLYTQKSAIGAFIGNKNPVIGPPMPTEWKNVILPPHQRMSSESRIEVLDGNNRQRINPGQIRQLIDHGVSLLEYNQNKNQNTLVPYNRG